jgi:hypothetical protein
VKGSVKGGTKNEKLSGIAGRQVLHFTGAPHTVKTGKRIKISKKVFKRWLEGASLDSHIKIPLDQSIQDNIEESN